MPRDNFVCARPPTMPLRSMSKETMHTHKVQATYAQIRLSILLRDLCPAHATGKHSKLPMNKSTCRYFCGTVALPMQPESTLILNYYLATHSQTQQSLPSEALSSSLSSESSSSDSSNTFAAASPLSFASFAFFSSSLALNCK